MLSNNERIREVKETKQEVGDDLGACILNQQIV